MDDLEVTEHLGKLAGWLQNNQALLINYAVNFVAVILIVVFGMIFARLLSNAASRLMQARHIDNTIGHFLSTLLRYAILIFAFVAALGQLGVPTTSVIAVLGAAGFAVALALQSSLSNLSAGVLLVAFRPLKVGEFVQLGSISGTVDSVQIFTTTLICGDNRTIIVPNGKIISSEIINFSRQQERRIDLTIGVDYSSDIDQVKAVLNAVIAEEKRILTGKEVTVRLNEMAPSSLNFVVRVWVNTAEYWPVYFDLMEKIKKTLDKNTIRIPVPKMDIRMEDSRKAG